MGWGTFAEWIATSNEEKRKHSFELRYWQIEQWSLLLALTGGIHTTRLPILQNVHLYKVMSLEFEVPLPIWHVSFQVSEDQVVTANRVLEQGQYLGFSFFRYGRYGQMIWSNLLGSCGTFAHVNRTKGAVWEKEARTRISANQTPSWIEDWRNIIGHSAHLRHACERGDKEALRDAIEDCHELQLADDLIGGQWEMNQNPSMGGKNKAKLTPESLSWFLSFLSRLNFQPMSSQPGNCFTNLLPGIIDSGRHVGFVRLDGRVEKEKYGLAQHQVSRILQPLEGFFIRDINDYIN